MASRMERYYKTEERSKKNEHLYRQINELESYSNIEGIADISNSNEININKVKEMIKSREDFQKTRNYGNLVKLQQEEEEIVDEEIEEKNYDIRDILNKAKVDHSDNNIKYRNLKNSQYDILRSLNIKEVPETEEEVSFDNNTADDLGIFDDLKSNTMVGDSASIKKILEEAKESQEKPVVEEVTSNNLANIDDTFYTSSFSFSDKDFEDLRSLDKSLKKNNKLIKILIVVFSILIALVILFVVIKLIF